MLETSLVRDARGRPIAQPCPTRSKDWDEVQAFCREVYMPYRVTPQGRGARPDATMRQAHVGRITMTRFSYGTPIHLDRFDPAAGNVLILNTLRGSLRHMGGPGGDPVTRTGDSFVVDCSRTDYWLDGDDAHMQLNLTIPHDVLAATAERWWGFVPDDRLWTARVGFGGADSSWQALLAYAVRSIGPKGQVAGAPRMARHLEDMICAELLQFWAAEAGVRLEGGARSAAPRHVRQAEEILTAEARQAPAIGDVAAQVGVSVRTLSEGFRRFRGVTPSEFLRDRRLEGFRAALADAREAETVTSVAADWGYVNTGALARLYRDRFGENPSDTLARARPLPRR